MSFNMNWWDLFYKKLIERPIQSDIESWWEIADDK